MTEFTVNEGNHYDITLVYKDEVGNVIDITGATAVMTARRSLYDAVLFTKNAVITGATGTMLFSLTPTETSNTVDTNKEQTSYLYDVQLTLSGGKISTLLEGTLCFKKPITRA